MCPASYRTRTVCELADGAEKSPPGVDRSVANEARIYDYYLGGKDNFAVDRAVAEATMAVVPDTPKLSRDNRDFTRRATRFLAEHGVRQFLDLGSGLPTSQNIHEVAQSVDPSCRVVYVDYDPVVLAHGRALLATNDNTTVVTADLREPDMVLGHPHVTRLLDLAQPVAVFMAAVLHFHRTGVEDLVRTYREQMVAGSWMVLSHCIGDHTPTEVIAGVKEAYANARSPAVFRSRVEVKALFGDFELAEPGFVNVSQWRPRRPGPKELTSVQIWGGVGEKR